ncbi:MAG TPA: penicillin-binding protein 1A [Gammaproteobacteria bacterium]
MQKFLKILRISSKIFFSVLTLALAVLIALYLYLEPKLPSIEGLSDIQLQVPLRIYSAEGGMIAEYGEKRRSPKAIDEIPLLLRQAFLAAEDDRFYEHPGVDYQGILRAAIVLLTTGERGQGGSTITMQLARNFYLSSEKTFARKLNEIFLALKIEQQLTKDQILELYLNKIYLGNRAYGVAAAAQVYYGKPLDELNLAQLSMIAGLPKAPSRYNPVINPSRALIRRDYVLGRMLDLGYISESDMRFAKAQPATAGYHESASDVSAPYVAEMVRAEISRQFGEEAYSRGLNVVTTINGRLQKAANQSMRNALLAYDMRHGYRGVEKQVDISDSLQEGFESPEERWEAAIEEMEVVADMHPALVVLVEEQAARVYLKGGRLINLDWDGLQWAKPYIDRNTQGPEPELASDILHPGDVVRIYQQEGLWKLGQVPEVQGALTSVRSNDGAIQALVGGFDFYHSKFNRAVQARRQAGSSFKPFVYSAALEKGYTPATLINDAPVVFHDPVLEGTWRPENYSGKFYGPTRLRDALVKSRNLVSIRILRDIGVRYAKNYAERFGFDSSQLPHDLSLALGTGEFSPLQLSAGFATFSNGGYRITPFFIQRIEDVQGNVLYEADPDVACVSCELEVQREREAARQAIAQKQAEDALLQEALADAGSAPQPPQQAGQDNETTAGTTVMTEEGGLAYRLPRQAERALDERIVYIMNSIMQDVINHGTGRRARALGRNDLHGKTGTTNDQKDAWFNGFNHKLVTTVWVGFDQQQTSLGNYETGSKAALPMWVEFMREALKGMPETEMQKPDGLVNVRINADTGELANDGDQNVVFEMFRSEYAPSAVAADRIPADANGNNSIPEQLF